MQREESISALMDDAGDAADHETLPALLDEPTMRETWARYQMIGDVLRGAEISPHSNQLSARVSAALSLEAASPTQTVVPFKPKPASWSPPRRIRWAAAAALVLGFTIGWSSRSPTGGTPDLQATAFAPNTLPTPDEPNVEGEQVSTLSPAEYQRRINRYLVNFNEQRAQLGVSGVHPHVRVVGLESAPAE